MCDDHSEVLEDAQKLAASRRHLRKFLKEGGSIAMPDQLLTVNEKIDLIDM